MSDSTYQVPIGPQHPALKEPENFLLTVDGEEIIDVKIRLGYVHRGGEKAFEARTYVQGLYLIERVCGICAQAHQLCYVNNLESMMEIEAPPRALANPSSSFRSSFFFYLTVDRRNHHCSFALRACSHLLEYVVASFKVSNVLEPAF